VKIKASKVTKIVENFLNKIPNLSPQYRIQAAKIKTDAILKVLKREAAKRDYINKRRVS